MIESIATKTDRNAPLRRWQRFKVDVRVKVRRPEEPDTVTVAVRSHVMSEGGMSVYAPESLGIGTSVLVEFELPGNLAGVAATRPDSKSLWLPLWHGIRGTDGGDRIVIRRFLQLLSSEHAESTKKAEVDPQTPAKPKCIAGKA